MEPRFLVAQLAVFFDRAHDDRVDARIGPCLPRRRHAIRPRSPARESISHEDHPGGVNVRPVIHGLTGQC